ncbi:acetate--CoA ligase [Bacteroidota bacterium]
MSLKIQTLSGYFHEYQKSVIDPDSFWTRIADTFHWRKRWDKTVKWNFTEPSIEWFLNGKLNITENMLDRYMFTSPDRTAIIWEPNDPNEEGRKISYRELYYMVGQFANTLKDLGVGKGDRVIIYMPMVPEAAVAMIACARIGAVHSVVFAGFSSNSLADRINDCSAKVVLTSDGNFRGTKKIAVKDVVDEAVKSCKSVEKVVVLKRTGQDVVMQDGRDIWWDEAIEGKSQECEAAEMDSEDMLYILYTSGSTGKPKGVVHTIGGYMVYTHFSFINVFQYNTGDIFWCSADIGWVTGHSYIIYGPLLAGATTVMFEGIPTYPDPGRFWAVIDKYKVNQFYTAPTAIRALQAFGQEPLHPYDLGSLKVLGTVGEPINEEAWHWYHDFVGKGRCPIVDTWWQTETGGILITPIASITPTKPSYATMPLPGIQPVIVDNDGNELKDNSVEGNLCIKYPWPGMFRTTYGDHERMRQTYFAPYKDLYFTGDGVKRDEDGYYRILGRVDDVMNVSGHRMGTAEVENAINEHPRVVESAVVGYPHKIKGQGIYAFVIADMTNRTAANLCGEIKVTVNNIIGPIARPDKIMIVPGLPKTRSGKIMRRILRQIASGDTNDFGDTSTLLDPGVVKKIVEAANAGSECV